MMRPRSVISLLLFAFIAAACAGAGQTRLDPRAATFGPPAFNAPVVAESALSGGAKLYTLEDHDVGLIRLQLAFAGGEVHDPAGKEGLSSITGAVWRSGGTKTHPAQEFDELLEARGIEIGLSLGRESGRATMSLLPRDLDYGLDLLAELLFEPAFSADRFDWAVKGAKASIRREEDDPDSLAFREMRKILYADHPRGRRATEETVGALKREDALELREALVASSAWVVGAVGDFDPAALAAKLEKRFGRLKFERTERFANPPKPKPSQPTIVFVKKKLPQSTILWAGFAPAILSPERVGIEVADFVLGGGGFQSRLSRKVRVERGLAYTVGSFYTPLEEFGVVGASAATATASAGEVFALMRGEIDRAGDAPFLPTEVEEAKKTEVNRYIFRFRDPMDLVAERMGLALRGLAPDLVERYYRELAAVSPESAASAAKRVYNAETGVWVVVGDHAEDDKAFDGPWRKVIVASGTAK